MNLSEPLTKENFWNDIMKDFPNATKRFCDWIDEYKETVNWDVLFGCADHVSKKTRIKFHNIPYDMQTGIWIKFANDILNECYEQPEYEYSGDLREDIKTVFNEIDHLEDLN